MEKNENEIIADGDAEGETEVPEEDFSALLDASQQRENPPVEKDGRVTGTVVPIGKEWVFVDIGGKTEGSIPREELLDEEDRLGVREGDS